jgi:hypothetical protein
LIFDKCTQTYNGEKTASSTNVAGKTKTISTSFTLCKYELKVNLNIRPENLKLVQGRLGNTLELKGIGNNFLSRTQMAQQLRERINKWDYMKSVQQIFTRLKRWPKEWEKIFVAIHLTRG